MRLLTPTNLKLGHTAGCLPWSGCLGNQSARGGGDFRQLIFHRFSTQSLTANLEARILAEV
jgi:hypothetical protein